MEGRSLRPARRPPSPPPPAGSATGDASLAESFRAAGTSHDGLSSSEAAQRLRSFGPNLLRPDAGTHPLAILGNQFRSPLILILLAAAALSFGLGETRDALIIALIVLGSSGLGFYQEFRASNAMEALRERLAITARVFRDGRTTDVPASEIVRGDIIVLAAGSLVPADGVLIEATDLHVDEAALTGESFPVIKAAAAESITDDNRIHMGTSIRSGSAKAVVLQTGAGTQFGSIVSAVGKLEPETSFARGVRRFGLLMTQIMMVMTALIFPINLLLGRPLLDSLLFSVALAVGLAPELLPAIVTVTLARGAQKLAKSGVLVRRLVAIENLGAMDVLCTDKTGTLTEGVVKLVRACDASGAASPETLKWAILNASLQTGLPNPLDEAIIGGATGVDIEAYEKHDEVPYDFERKRLSVLVSGPEGNWLICKGAVAAILPVCARVRAGDQSQSLTGPRRKAEERRLEKWSAQGYRVLAVAVKAMGANLECDRPDEAELTLLGYLLFSDPPKPAVAETIAALEERGVRLKIVTGDNRYVAAHIAAEVGIPPRHVMTGGELAELTDRALARRAPNVDIFAEVTPDQKERIVAALRRSHKVVGYLGDGINDTPALRAADLGISVDTAVEAAKEAADIVLLRRDLNVLLDGIVIGRTAFANTLKYITITTSANLGNMISMAVASLFLPFLPLLAAQILLNNLMSDLPMLAISTDKVDADVLVKPGRWDLPALMRSMLRFGLLSSAFDGLTFALLLLVFRADAALFQTGWFLVSLLTELAIVVVMRTRKPFYGSLPSPLLIATSIGVAALALSLPYLPLAEPLGFRPLPLPLALTLLGITLAYATSSEILKLRNGAAQHLRRRTE